MNSTFAPRDRRGEWILTFSGERFYPFSPAPEEVKTKDIAHALANICRFNGHTRGFYSVAAHSVHVSRLVPPEFALEALLHDAAEAYVGDMVRPLKRGLPAFEEVEGRVRSAIAARYRIPRELSACVREADDVALATEARDLFDISRWELRAAPDESVRLGPTTPLASRDAFLGRYAELTGGRP